MKTISKKLTSFCICVLLVVFFTISDSVIVDAYIQVNERVPLLQGIPTDNYKPLRFEEAEYTTARQQWLVLNDCGQRIAKSISQARWKCDTNLHLTNYAILEQSASILLPGVPVKVIKSVRGAYFPAPDNLRLTLSFEFAEPCGVTVVLHQYNLMGTGTYSFQYYD